MTYLEISNGNNRSDYFLDLFNENVLNGYLFWDRKKWMDFVFIEPPESLSIGNTVLSQNNEATVNGQLLFDNKMKFIYQDYTSFY